MKKGNLRIFCAAFACAGFVMAGCGGSTPAAKTGTAGGESTEAAAEQAAADQAAADHVAELIDAIYVQERTDKTDEQCAEAKKAWDALTDAQKALVHGENADPEYFGRDTGDASKDDPGNGDNIGEKEILAVSFGTSFNDSRAEDIGGIEKALAAAYPDWSVRRAFTAQIILNHIEARDGEKIDNMDQALQRAVDNGVKELVVQPTHLMHGAEYDELCASVDKMRDRFASVTVAEPLLGEVGEDNTVVNADKEAVAKAVTAQAVKTAGFASLDAAAADGTAFVFMGHGTSHEAQITYDQMQAQMDALGYKNVFIGTVEGKPADTACEAVIGKVRDAGYRKAVLRPLMVVAGDHANNDMADADDPDSWLSQFKASGNFDRVDCQIEGMGRIPEIEAIYVSHTKAAMDGTSASEAGSGNSAAPAARAGVALCERRERLVIIPALPGRGRTGAPGTAESSGPSAPAGQETCVLMKSGSSLGKIRDCCRDAGLSLWVMENCGMPGERIYRNLEEIPEKGGYFTLAVVRGQRAREILFAEPENL